MEVINLWFCRASFSALWSYHNPKHDRRNQPNGPSRRRGVDFWRAAESCTRQAKVREEQRSAFWGSKLAIPLPGGGLLRYISPSASSPGHRQLHRRGASAPRWIGATLQLRIFLKVNVTPLLQSLGVEFLLYLILVLSVAEGFRDEPRLLHVPEGFRDEPLLLPVPEGFGDEPPTFGVPVAAPEELEIELPPLPVSVHLYGLAEDSSGFCTAIPSSTAGFLVVILQAAYSEGPLHVWVGLLTSVVGGASGTIVVLLDSGSARNDLPPVRLNSKELEIELPPFHSAVS
ncbi:hypothetical protein CRENBAI_003199 [Crenichthys baileyi]|uniref:Uncharacterized protein n=1 Tax=Crenichthys baileyi TaxID=28760 RepID=A0AAV9RGM6_9TELE